MNAGFTDVFVRLSLNSIYSIWQVCSKLNLWFERTIVGQHPLLFHRMVITELILTQSSQDVTETYPDQAMWCIHLWKLCWDKAAFLGRSILACIYCKDLHHPVCFLSRNTVTCRKWPMLNPKQPWMLRWQRWSLKCLERFGGWMQEMGSDVNSSI